MRRLHFGCGPNRLRPPWENFDRDVNIAHPLPFEDSSAAFIFAEHVIEHVPFIEGMAFLRECLRVLEPSGVLRFAFPDVTRFVDASAVDEYSLFLKARNRRASGRGDVFRFIMLDNGHRACWTKDIGMAACAAVGFAHVYSPPYGDSTRVHLKEIDGHHRTSPVALLETTVLEASK